MGSGPSFDVRVESRDGDVRVVASGELDLATAATLDAALRLVERDGTREVVLDMDGATFVDSTGLRAIIQAWQRAQGNGHRLTVVGASARVRQLCVIAGVEFILDDPSQTAIVGRSGEWEPV